MWIIVVLLALVAPARADATWDQVAALAKPTAKRGSSKQLAVAMAIAKKHDKEWSELHYKYPAPPLADYPDGKPAMAALLAWHQAGGGLPPEAAPMERGKRGVTLMRIAQVAIASADVEHRAQLDAAIYLANVMVEDGENFLVISSASSLYADATRKAKELVVATDKWPAKHFELVRALAAEAISRKTTNEWARTPAGKKAMADALAAMDPELKGAAEGVTGVAIAVPTDEELAKNDAFFLAALAGAKRDEPPATTLARVHAVVNGDAHAGLYEHMLQRLHEHLD